MRRPQKTCAICESGVRVVDFKDERTLSRFLTERGKILPSRLSGTCARHQRQLSTAIKLDDGVLRFLVVVNEGAQPVPVTAAKSEEEDDE